MLGSDPTLESPFARQRHAKQPTCATARLRPCGSSIALRCRLTSSRCDATRSSPSAVIGRQEASAATNCQCLAQRSSPDALRDPFTLIFCPGPDPVAALGTGWLRNRGLISCRVRISLRNAWRTTEPFTANYVRSLRETAYCSLDLHQFLHLTTKATSMNRAMSIHPMIGSSRAHWRFIWEGFASTDRPASRVWRPASHQNVRDSCGARVRTLSAPRVHQVPGQACTTVTAG